MWMRKGLDTITLFHKATSPGSVRVLAALKNASAQATAGASARPQFELDVTEAPPTLDQLKCIFEYMNKMPASSIVKGASTPDDAFKKFKESSLSFQRPVVVDWDRGRAIATDNESEILKMINASMD